MNGKSKNVLSVGLFASVSFGIIFYVASKYRKDILKKIRSTFNFNGVFKNQKINVVNNLEECRLAVNQLKLDCEDYNVIGFDCEWNSVGGRRRPISLLQLTSNTGFCALIRLCNLKRIPPELKELLEDDNIIKVGVVPQDDAKYIAQDYNVCIASTLDLRHMAKYCGGLKIEGLGKMAKSQLNVELDKNWRISCSDWEAQELTDKQKEYAAKDSHVAIELFKNMANIMTKKSIFTSKLQILKEALIICDVYLDVKFSSKSTSSTNKQSKKNNMLKPLNRNLCTRTKPLYDNCFLQAPDGDLLCTCEKKKAYWYISKGLGEKISDEPLIVRLNFEPSGRCVGESGEYYKQEKENCCVACGKTESFIKKNTVPREYRKLFPDVMKTHTSHDVVLMCTGCHQRSNISDLKLRNKLAELCDAPLMSKDIGKKYVEIPQLKQVRSCARGLLNKKFIIPEKRKTVLENTILQYFPHIDELTPEFLSGLVNIETNEYVENYTSHAQKVVDYFNSKNGGLLELERMWREHFIEAMRPQYLPALWSVTHNENRLEIRADEGRIDINDLLIAGLDPKKLMDFNKNKSEKETSDNNEDNNIQFDISNSPVKDNDDEDDNDNENYDSGCVIDSNLLPLYSPKSDERNNSMLTGDYDSDDSDSLKSQPSSRISDLEDISIS